MSVPWSKNGALVVIAIFVALGWVLIAAVGPDRGGPSLSANLVIGLVLGTIFGQVSLAAAWCALGPFALIRRLPLAFAWLAAIVVAFGVNISGTTPIPSLILLLVYAGAMLIQWLLVQAPLWLLVGRYGMHVHHRNDHCLVRSPGDQQFGIRQVMILTALVATVLGVGRLALGGLKQDEPLNDWRGVLLFAFLVVTNAIISIPLIVAVLLPRRAPIAVCGAITAGTLVTAIEQTLLPFVFPSPRGTDDFWVFVVINLFQFAWILAVLFVLRAGGYRLGSRPVAVTASNGN
jgi:hypothetical protein